MVGQTLAKGFEIGSYRVEEQIGVVYRACRAGDGAGDVAIKVAKRPATSLSMHGLVSQQNEIEVLTRLRHPSLVSVLGYGYLSDKRIYVVMDLAKGEVLSEYLQRRVRLDALEAIHIVRRAHHFPPTARTLRQPL